MATVVVRIRGGCLVDTFSDTDVDVILEDLDDDEARGPEYFPNETEPERVEDYAKQATGDGASW